MKKLLLTIIAITFLTTPTIATETKTPEFTIQIKNHTFIPETLEIPAEQKFKLIVENLDATAEEFESNDLQKEKIVLGGKKITIFFTPLKAGEYSFVGEFHPKTAKGKLIVK